MHAAVERILLAGWMVLLASACGGAQKSRVEDFPLPGATDLVVEEFTITGVDSVDEGDLRAGLETEVVSIRSSDGLRWIPGIGVEAETFNHVEWEKDLRRIETFYQARGYFSAAVVRSRVNEHPERGTVTLEIAINEGDPTTVKNLEVNGLEVLDRTEYAFLTSLSLSEGEVFTEQEYVNSREKIRAELEDNGYAYARVEGRAIIEPSKNAATVIFHVDPGPLAEFGEVSLEGLETIERDSVREAVTFEKGERYSPSKLQETQERIYDLGVFATVKVNPQIDDGSRRQPTGDGDVEGAGAPPPEPTGGLSDLIGQAQEDASERLALDPVIPVTIRLNEAKLWNLRVGAGVAADVTRQDIHGRADWGSRNFLGGLRKLEHFNTVGYAWAPSFLASSGSQNSGVILDSELRFTQPQFIERFTKLEARLRFQRQVEIGYSLISPTASIGVRRRFFRRLTAEFSYNFALYLLSNLDQSLLDPDLRLQPEYILEYLQQRIAWDQRNHFLNPTKGWIAELQFQEATSYVGAIPGNPFGGNFDYFAPLVALEGYVPIPWPATMVLAARSRLATIYTMGRGKQPPLPQRLYSGGADSMRSLGRQELSMYSLEGEAIPVGGLTKFESAVELRIRLIEKLLDVGDLWFAPFLDGATILPGPLGTELVPGPADPEEPGSLVSTLVYGTGVGAWWVTPIGPVRLDFGYTLTDIREDGRFRRCLVKVDYNLNCPVNARVPIAEDNIQQKLSRWNIIIGIGHSL